MQIRETLDKIADVGAVAAGLFFALLLLCAGLFLICFAIGGFQHQHRLRYNRRKAAEAKATWQANRRRARILRAAPWEGPRGSEFCRPENFVFLAEYGIPDYSQAPTGETLWYGWTGEELVEAARRPSEFIEA